MPEATPAATTPAAPPAPPPTATPPAATPPAPTSLLSTTTDGGAAGGTQQATPSEPPKGEPAKATEAPTELELKLPPGVEADAALLGEFKPLVKEMGLKGEQAQKLLDFHVKALAQRDEKVLAGFEQARKAWVESIKADKDFGGAQFDQNVKVAQRAIREFGAGDPELTQFLESGAGDNPAFVRFAIRVGKKMAEDSIAGSSAGPSTDTSAEAKLRLQYPTMFPKTE